MSVSIVVGGQYGSEGKGKVAYFWAKRKKVTVAVRVGGSNSGHTIINELKEKCIFRILPTASIIYGIISVIPSGAYIDINVLKHEIEKYDIKNIIIDPFAVIITEKNRNNENNSKLSEKIGSTQSGTGNAIISRIARDGSVVFA
jgi:adenylosuccinate synthase